MHVMINIETLSTKPNAAIMQVAAVLFDLQGTMRVPMFNEYVTLESQQDYCRVDTDTIRFWFGVEPNARAHIIEGFDRAMPIKTVLNRLILWPLQNFDIKWENIDTVWAKPSTFDIPILETAFANLNISAPWQYSQVKDVRSFVQGLTGDDRLPSLPNGGYYMPNHAVDDCKMQIRSLQLAYKEAQRGE